MDILDKAKELGRSIASSDEMIRLKNAEAALETDLRANQLMNDYKKFQMDVVRATKDKKDKNIIDKLKEDLIQKQLELNEYSITKEYLLSKNEFDGFMKTVNDVIIFSITGEEPCSTKKCSSCGGGCGK